MPELLTFGGLLSVLGITAFFLRGEPTRRRSRRRLMLGEVGRAAVSAAPAAPARPVVGRYRIWPWVIAAAAGVGIWFWLGPIFAAAIGLILGLLLFQAEAYWAERRTARIEQQLADAIDLMVGALHAGASATVALDRAGEESAQPLRGLLRDGMARVRYGDDPSSVMRRFERQVPTESARLFATTMSVHWEVGGSLAPTLAVVGRVIRDRIEVGRRVRSLTSQARVSTVMLLITTYFIALLMWRQNPAGTRVFLKSDVGAIAVAGSMVLQAVGIVWQALASRNMY